MANNSLKIPIGYAVWYLIFSFQHMNIIEPAGKLGILLSVPLL
jgi:hypothetical protein